MTDETKALVERLRHVLMLYNDGHIEAAKKIIAAAIAALSRPLPGVVEGVEPSELAVEAGMAAWLDEESPTLTNESVVGKIYGAMIAIDLAPRVAAGYARGVEDAAKVAMRHKSKIAINEPLWHDGADWACQRIEDAIRALLPKEPATEEPSNG